jgi:RNA polymerase sigma-70 factor (ECF subfamily)
MRYMGEGGIRMKEHGVSSYRRFLRGETDALEVLVTTYSDELVRFAFGYVKSEAAAEDVVSDSFATLFMKAKSFSEDDQLRAFLYKIVRNRSVDYLRRHRRELPLEDVEGALSVSDAEGRLLEKERDEALHRCLAKLPPQYREVLELTWFEEFSNEQVASILGKSAKQVYNLRSRAKETLKKMLEKEGITREDIS